jgi:hypothetical protein
LESHAQVYPRSNSRLLGIALQREDDTLLTECSVSLGSPPHDLASGGLGIRDIRIYGWKTHNSTHLDARYLLPFAVSASKSASNSVNQPASIPMNSQGSEASSSSSGDAMHRLPHAVGLGVVLMQILLGEKLKNLESFVGTNGDVKVRYLHDDIKDSVNDKLIQALRLQKLCEARFPRASALMQGIDQCTSASLFGPTLAVEDRANVFRENIIVPLERAILQDDGRSLTSSGLDDFLHEPPPEYTIPGDIDELFTGSSPLKRSHDLMSRETSRVNDSMSNSRVIDHGLL